MGHRVEVCSSSWNGLETQLGDPPITTVIQHLTRALDNQGFLRQPREANGRQQEYVEPKLPP